MSPFITNLISACFVLAVLFLIAEWWRTKAAKPFLVQLVLLAVVFIVLNATTGFPVARVAFGGASPIAVIALMFLATLLGIAARHFFFAKKFTWRSFLKPILITPIILLPLLSSVQGSDLEAVQLISLVFLAFQNGFFWKVVLERAEANLP